MKLRQIEEIATKQVPVWQPVLLTTLLLLGIVVVPRITKNTPSAEKKTQQGLTLGVGDIKKQVVKGIDSGVNTVLVPLSNNIQKEAGVVLGLAQQAVQQTVQNVASQSANQAKEFVFDATLGKMLQNIQTLPQDQQNLIKNAICK